MCRCQLDDQRRNRPLTVGVLVAFTAYIGRFWAPINTLAGFYNSLLTAISYLERIFETIDEPVVVKDRKDAVEMPPIHGDVAFDHVTFSYEPGVPILKDVSFHANQGQSFAVVGPTGAGKTTLVNLLSRFYNVDSGRILIRWRRYRRRYHPFSPQTDGCHDAGQFHFLRHNHG